MILLRTSFFLCIPSGVWKFGMTWYEILDIKPPCYILCFCYKNFIIIILIFITWQFWGMIYNQGLDERFTNEREKCIFTNSWYVKDCILPCCFILSFGHVTWRIFSGLYFLCHQWIFILFIFIEKRKVFFFRLLCSLV